MLGIKMARDNPENTSINPDYYKSKYGDVITYIEQHYGADGAIYFCIGNVLKYITRYKHKNGIEDLYKADTYLHRLIRLEEGKN